MNEEAHKIARKIERLRREFSMLATLESRHNPLEIEEYQHYLLELEELLIVFKYLMDPANQPVQPISNESQIIEEEVIDQSSTEIAEDIVDETAVEPEAETEELIEIEPELIDSVYESEPEQQAEVEQEDLIEEHIVDFVESENSEDKEETLIEEEVDQIEKSEHPTGSSLNERVSANDHSLAGKLARQPIADLRKAFGLNERFLYANELFGGDGQEFIRALNELNHLENFEDAKRMIEARYQNTFKWNLEDETVQEFISIVERRYL